MNRSNKLYDRADELILEYKDLLIQELIHESKGHVSIYFRRKADLFNFGTSAVGKYWQDEKVALIEGHEKTIISLGKKLKDKSLLKLCALSDEYVENTMKLDNRFKGQGKALARKYIELIKGI